VTAPDVEALRTLLTSSPAAFPLEATAAGDAILFAMLSEHDYRAASFLDRRLLTAERRTGTVPRDLLRPGLAALPRGCDFIFHVSHCGSTLLSRLLAGDPAVLPLREPAILRQAALRGADDRMADDALPLLARTFRPGQRAMIKATSVVNRIAAPLLHHADDALGLLVTVPAETFLAAVLDGSPGDILAHAGERFTRLQECGVPMTGGPESLGVGEAAAAGWLCENLTLADLARRFPDRTTWLDFDRFLAAPAAGLAAALAAFGLTADPAAILAGGVMTRYAKRPEVAYDAAFRHRLLADARARLGDAIEAGLSWLDRIGAAGLLEGTPASIAAGERH